VRRAIVPRRDGSEFPAAPKDPRRGQIDLTETHKRDMRDARDGYQRAIDYLEMKATGAIPAAHESARSSRAAMSS
jgi:hypothetical protein